MHFSLQNRRELKSRRHSAGFIDGKKMKCSDLAWGTRCLGKDLFSEQNWSRFLFPSLSLSFSLSPFFRSGETDMRFRIFARPRNPARSIYRPCAARFRESLTDYNGSESRILMIQLISFLCRRVNRDWLFKIGWRYRRRLVTLLDIFCRASTTLRDINSEERSQLSLLVYIIPYNRVIRLLQFIQKLRV